ncbi:Uncharacterised protein [BD1-7 clade bacterium]|uniref:Rieske domain-containing protein n=1 Tax=BD1-7 clade bacterium TaxID=2029982 RepID=A0A5S9MXG2_9GAMM|nr:Uncharacterised protein [BD1-7 clade bacterium]
MHRKLCHLNDIDEDSSKGFIIDDVSVFAVKKDGQIFVYKNSCPHLGVELEMVEDQFLDADNVLIQCATHGALFLIESGECVAGPCQGQALQQLPNELDENQQIMVHWE